MTRCVSFLLLACLFSHCSFIAGGNGEADIETKTDAGAPTEEVLIHQVRFQGESLSMIAEWYTGRQSQWKDLLLAQEKAESGLLQSGDIIRIPTRIVLNPEPLNEEFVRAFLLKQTSSNGGDQLEDGDVASQGKVQDQVPEEVTEEFIKKALID